MSYANNNWNIKEEEKKEKYDCLALCVFEDEGTKIIYACRSDKREEKKNKKDNSVFAL